MNEQTIYQSDAEAKLQLTELERAAALKLLESRPTVLPGTRAILNPAKATTWFNEVTDSITKLGIDQDVKKVAAFCDLAGVPD